jgi:hypothetical protein
MKRIGALLLTVMMLLSTVILVSPVGAEEDPVPNATTARTVLLELFTGADCPPCVPTDNAVDEKDDDYTRDELAIVVYHRDIPRPDKLEVQDAISRQGWYGGTSTPNMWVDGVEVRIGSAGQAAEEAWIDAAYSTRSAKASQFTMTANGIISPSLTGNVWVNVTALETPTLSNLYVHTVIVRKTYGPWNGGNGRKMLPTYNGEAFTITNGQTLEFTYSFDLSGDHNGADYWSDKDDMAIIAFVQTHNKQIIPGSSRYTAEVAQSQYGTFTVIPNKAPEIVNGHVDVPVGTTEDDDVTFKVFYSDIDDFADRGPDVAKVHFKNATSGVLEHDLSPEPSANNWIAGKWLKWTTQLGPGTYTYRFSANDGEDDASGDTDWNTTQFTILPRNKIPALMTPNFGPMSGDTNTIFRFDIMYRDGDNQEATQADIFINGVAYPMSTDSSGPFNSWVVYYYETKLPVGENHKFYFMFSDGKDSKRLPAKTESPNWILGPEVEPPNNEPTLMTPMFSPSEGTRMDEFTFSVMYTDGENDHPTVSYIFVDDVPSIMDPEGTNYLQGVRFSFRTKLDIGPHDYYFKFSDGRNEVRYPAAGVIEGPVVTNMDPMAVVAAPTDGVRYTPTDYIPFSAIGSDDPENDELVYEWMSDIDGKLSDLEAFDMRLTEGMHTITLTVTDEFGGAHSSSVIINVRPYLPDSFIDGYIASTGSPIEMDQVRYTVTVDNDGEARDSGLEVRFLVDGALISSDTISVDINTPMDVRFTWVAEEGEHTIRFEISGDFWEDNILVTSNSEPTALPDIINPGGITGKHKINKEIYFKANATDANGDALTYNWDFGDGQTQTQADPSHIYTQPGTYTVSVTITDERGGSVTESITIKVIKPKGDESPGFGAALVAAALVLALVGAAMGRRRE